MVNIVVILVLLEVLILLSRRHSLLPQHLLFLLLYIICSLLEAFLSMLGQERLAVSSVDARSVENIALITVMHAVRMVRYMLCVILGHLVIVQKRARAT